MGRGSSYLKAGRPRIVTNNRLPVRRESHIKLETIAALGKRDIERAERVLWNSPLGTRPAVAKKQWTSLHRVRFYCAVNLASAEELTNAGNAAEELTDACSTVQERRFSAA